MKKSSLLLRVLCLAAAVLVPVVHSAMTNAPSPFIFFSYRELFSYSGLIVVVSLLLLTAFGFLDILLENIKNFQQTKQLPSSILANPNGLFWICCIPLLSGMILFSIEYYCFMLTMTGDYAIYLGRLIQKSIFLTMGLLFSVLLGGVSTYFCVRYQRKEWI